MATSSGANVSSQVLVNVILPRKSVDEIPANGILVPGSTSSVDEAGRVPMHQDKPHGDDSRVFGEDSSEDKIDVELGESGTAADIGGPTTHDEAYNDDRSNDDEYRETLNGQTPWNGSHSAGSGGQGTGPKLSVGDSRGSGSDGQSTVTGDQSPGTGVQSSAISGLSSATGDMSSGTSGQSPATIDQSPATGDQSSGTGDQANGTGDQYHVNNGQAPIHDGVSRGNNDQAPVGVGQGYIHGDDLPQHNDQRTVVHGATAFHPVAMQKPASRKIASMQDSDKLILPAQSRHYGVAGQAEGQPGGEPHVRGSTELTEEANSREEDSSELSEDAKSEEEVAVVALLRISRERMLSTIVGAVVIAFFFTLVGVLFALMYSRIE